MTYSAVDFIRSRSVVIALFRSRDLVCKNPEDLSTLPRGFVLDEADPPRRLVAKGRHWFSRYRLTFELGEVEGGRTELTAISHAAFPGLHGRIYRALVIGSGGHRLVVRDLLRRIAGTAEAGAA